MILQMQPLKLLITSSVNKWLPNYAIKVTSVKYLFSSFTSGASAPYFGCYALVVKTQLCNKH